MRHYEATDEFCLSYDERVRLAERLADQEKSSDAFQSELERLTTETAAYVDIRKPGQIADLVIRARRVLERFLLGRGEQFATALKTGDLSGVGLDSLKDLVISDVSIDKDAATVGGNLVTIVTQTVESIVTQPGDASQAFMRSLADTYTLFAFLRETPDVQGAIVKMFGEGEVWLDASIILPLLGETLLEPGHRRFTNMLAAAREAGLQFYMTSGVLEEVERHINRSIVCTRTRAQDWRGPVPFLYAIYASSGLPLGEFGRWTEECAGPARPLDDVTEYLEEVFAIRRRSLEAESAKAGTELRGAVQEIWHEAKTRRHQANRRELDALTVQRLVAHDVENFLGVISRRKEQPASVFGYTTWWLTLDRTAFEARRELQERVGGPTPDSPVLSPDFLVNYLALGPMRAKVSKTLEAQLPIALDVGVGEFLPPELLDAANTVRTESAGLPERVIRRRVRDTIDAWKTRKGPIAEGGVGGAQRDMQVSAEANSGKHGDSG